LGWLDGKLLIKEKYIYDMGRLKWLSRYNATDYGQYWDRFGRYTIQCSIDEFNLNSDGLVILHQSKNFFYPTQLDPDREVDLKFTQDGQAYEYPFSYDTTRWVAVMYYLDRQSGDTTATYSRFYDTKGRVIRETSDVLKPITAYVGSESTYSYSRKKFILTVHTFTLDKEGKKIETVQKYKTLQYANGLTKAAYWLKDNKWKLANSYKYRYYR
jgi:hypothetical protein